MAALDAHERGDLALLAGFSNFSRRRGQNHIVRMLADLLADRVNLDQRAVHGLGAGHLAGDPDGKENCAQIAFAHARKVNAARGAARSQIEFSVEEALRGVIVRVYDDGRKVQLASLLRNADRKSTRLNSSHG